MTPQGHNPTNPECGTCKRQLAWSHQKANDISSVRKICVLKVGETVIYKNRQGDNNQIKYVNTDGIWVQKII